MTVTTLTSDQAYTRWIAEHPLAYEVTIKFDDDHIIKSNLSKQTSIAAALDRYRRNQTITLSSWLVLDKETIVNKVRSAQKRASVHQLAQQLIVAIKVTRRTVTIQRLTPKERHQYEHKTVEIGNETHYLNCASTEANIDLLIVGPWKPVTGRMELYHYQEGALPVLHEMLEKYRKWKKDDTTKEIIGPVATD